MKAAPILLLLPIVLVTGSCNLLDPDLGRVDLDRFGSAEDALPQEPLETRARSKPQTIEEGLEAMRSRGYPIPDDTAALPMPEGMAYPMTVGVLRREVLKNNLDLAVQLFDPAIARTKVSAEEGRFDAIIGSRASFGRTETPRLDGDLVDFSSGNPALDDQIVKLTELEQTQEKLDLGLGVFLPTPTGGVIGFDTTLQDKSITDPQQFDQYLAASRFSFSQPLLRNAGTTAALAPIRLTRVDQRVSEVRTRLAAVRILAKAEKAYWRLYAARRFLDVRQEQLRLAQELLQLTRGLASEGLIPEVEITRVEAGLFLRLESLVVAQTELNLRQRDLKRFMNSPQLPLRGDTLIEVTTEPLLVGLDLDRQELLRQALASRLDLIEIELGLVRDGISIDLLRNQTLPIVNLDFQYGTLERDASLGSAWGSQWDFDNQDLYVGLSMEVPLTNQRRLAQLEGTLLSRAKRMATKRQRVLTVREEVLDMVDVIERNWQRILAARLTVLAAGVNYDAERRQFEQGIGTMREVFEALTAVGNSQTREIKAIVDYQVAQIDLAFASGTLLGYARVGLEEPLFLPDGQ